MAKNMLCIARQMFERTYYNSLKDIFLSGTFSSLYHITFYNAMPLVVDSKIMSNTIWEKG